MISLSQVISVVIKTGSRIVKVMQFGAKTADECAPFGDDSSPLKDMVAVYADTQEIGEPIIIGYLNENQLAAPGEKRFYSLKPNGDLSFYAWLKNDGTMEIGGKTDNMVRFNPLNNGLSNQNTAINAELTKIAVAITALGGTYVPTQISLNIAQSKINEIKTI